MNLSSIWCHCLLHRKSLPWQIALSLDVGCTGASASALAAAAVCVPRSPSRVVALMALLSAGYTAAALCANLLPLPFVNELIYLAPIAMAIALLPSELLRLHSASGGQPWWLAVAYFGAALGLSAVAVDRTMCRHLGPGHGMVQVAFCGSNVAFLGIGGLLGAWRWGKDGTKKPKVH